MKVTPLLASRFRADGGAMFGLVPKPIWSRLIVPDERNRIAQNANCLLVELPDGRKGLVDTGCGDPAWHPEKDRRNHGLDACWWLSAELRRHGTAFGEIAFVILSHLHWDHVGGTGRVTEDGAVHLTFPNARHFVHAAEWRDAISGDPLLGQAYPRSSLAALRASRNSNVELVSEASAEILPGIRVVRSGGHTFGHCTVVLSGPDLALNHPAAVDLGGVEQVVYAADVCPTASHLRPVFQTAFDTHPLDTRRWKLEQFPRMAAGGQVLMFDHDPELAGATLAPDDRGGFVVAQRVPVLA